MTIVHYGNQLYKGLAADTKPTPALTAVGATFEEVDTGKRFYNTGTVWQWFDIAAPAPSATPAFETYRRTGTTPNRWYITNQLGNAALGTLVMTANTLYAMPFVVSKPCSINDMGINITAGVTSAQVRVGIYTDLNGYPDTRLKDGGALTASAAAFDSNVVTPALALDPGIYWVAVVSGHAPTVKAVPTGDSYPILGTDNVAASQISAVGWTVAFTMAVPPSTFTAGGAVRNAAMPGVYVRLA